MSRLRSAGALLDPRRIRCREADMGTPTELMRYIVCANFCDLPAISFPAGYLKEGTPGRDSSDRVTLVEGSPLTISQYG